MRIPQSDTGPFHEYGSARGIHFDVARKAWALCDRFRGALEDFIHTRRYDRALSWEHELASFLQSWKARGIIVSEPQQARLRALLGELRDQLVPADQSRAMREDAAKIAALHRTWRPIELGEPKSPAEAANSVGLRKFGHDLMARNPPEQWLERVTEWFGKLRLTDEMKSQFWAWIAAEQAAALKSGGPCNAPSNSSVPEPPSTAPPASTAPASNGVPDWVKDPRTELLWRLGETNVKRFPVDLWVTAARNILNFISATEEAAQHFLQWIADEQRSRMGQMQLGPGETGASDSPETEEEPGSGSEQDPNAAAPKSDCGAAGAELDNLHGVSVNDPRAKLTFEPVVTQNMPWSIIEGSRYYGKTLVEAAVDVQAVQFSTGRCIYFGISAHVYGMAQISIDVGNITADGPRYPELKLSLGNVYGHEQRHVESARNYLGAVRSRLDEAGRTYSFCSRDLAEAYAKQLKEFYNHDIEVFIKREAMHKNPTSPREGQPIPPIGGQMPKGTPLPVNPFIPDPPSGPIL